MTPETFRTIVWRVFVLGCLIALAVCDRSAWVRLSIHDAMHQVDTHQESPFQRLQYE